MPAGNAFGAWGGLIAQGVGNTIAAIGSFGVTKHQNAIAQSQANIARLNAQLAMNQYENTLRAGEKQIQQVTMAAGRTRSSQRAALAANGVAIGEGSAAELQASTDIVKEIDVNQIKSNAFQQAWGYRMQAANYEGQATMAEASKQNKWLTAGATLMGASRQSVANYMQSAMSFYNGYEYWQGMKKPADEWVNFAGASKYGFSTNSSGWGSFSSRYGNF